jgi:hypothetical protein
MNQSQGVAITLQCLVSKLSICKPKVGAMEGPKSKIETPQIHSPWQWVMICEKIQLFIYNT